MSYKLYKIRGKSTASRNARLDALQKRLEALGWFLVDYAEGTGTAMFERDIGVSPLSLFDSRRWRFSPSLLSGMWEEWAQPRNLVIGLAAVIVMGVVSQMMGGFVLDGSKPSVNAEMEAWWNVTVDKLNIREEPTSQSRIVGILHLEEKVMVGEERGKWIEIIKPYRGFVAKQYVQPKPADGEQDPSPAQ